MAILLVSSLDLNCCKPAVILIMEGLLAHFFLPIPNQQQYYTEDILWFLNLANEQQWGDPFEGGEEGAAGMREESVGVVFRELEDDLLPKSEESNTVTKVLKCIIMYTPSRKM